MDVLLDDVSAILDSTLKWHSLPGLGPECPLPLPLFTTSKAPLPFVSCWALPKVCHREILQIATDPSPLLPRCYLPPVAVLHAKRACHEGIDPIL